MRETLKRLKKEAGSHSPSMTTLREHFPSFTINVDACFLSNPYATDLFFERLEQDFHTSTDLRSLIEFYPSQNRKLARKLQDVIEIPSSNIFVGNGATEIIQSTLHNFVKNSIAIPLPTFSPYYEFIPENITPYYFKLLKENDFQLDLAQYEHFIRTNKIDTAIIINPNNPTGTYTSYQELVRFLTNLSDLHTIIVDESFIHFADKNEIPSVSSLVERFPNLVVIKSMSKDFGIAGIRVGYGILSSSRVSHLLNYGYLWNLNGFAEYFLSLYSDRLFQREYQKRRKQFIEESYSFYSRLETLPSFTTYPSRANFILLELQNSYSADELFAEMLTEKGIYVRTCSDKAGLENGEFVRIASRGTTANELTFDALREYVEE